MKHREEMRRRSYARKMLPLRRRIQRERRYHHVEQDGGEQEDR
jgi:hypothetical protein